MDKRVFLLVGAMLALGGILFTVNMLSDDCDDFLIKSEPQTVYVGDEVTFTTDAEPSDEIQWEFGDGNKVAGTMVPKTRYDKAGKYEVKAMISDGCKSVALTLNVLEKRTMQVIKPTVEFPPVLYAGEAVLFNDRTPEATAWLWSVVGSGETGSQSTFSTNFARPGSYRLALSVSGEFINGTDTFDIVVTKKPREEPAHVVAKQKPPPPPPAPALSEEQILANKVKSLMSTGNKQFTANKYEAARSTYMKVLDIDPGNAVAISRLQQCEIKISEAATPAEKVEPAKATILTNAQFADYFERIANDLPDPDDNNQSSIQWKEKIVSQTEKGKGNMTVIVKEDGREPKSMPLQTFKSKQIMTPWNILDVPEKEILRNVDKSIRQVTVVVTK
jgi:PKD repeat protein